MPNRQPIWAVVQDHVNGNLLFAGTEFGLFFSPDGGQRWVQLRGGLPTAQVRDLDVQRRETDLALGTFGRSFYVLDDYSPLRGVTAEAMGQEAALFPLRHAYQYAQLSQYRAGPGNWAADNPPYGALLTYHLRENPPPGTSYAIRISNASMQRVRQLPLEGTAGLQRIAWNLTADPAAPPPSAGDQAGGRGAGAGRGGGGGGGRGGRGGGGPQGPAVDPGRYFAQMVKISGGTETPIGPAHSFEVRPLPR
jgi:hypothetical protein